MNKYQKKSAKKESMTDRYILRPVRVKLDLAARRVILKIFLHIRICGTKALWRGGR